MSRDVLKQYQTQDQQRYRLLVDTLPYGIEECDKDGVITFSNPAYSKMLGYKDEELVGKRIWELLADQTGHDELRKYVAYLVSERPPPTTYLNQLQTKDGSAIDVQIDWAYQ